jgi:Ca2+:H+ antiporter
VWSLKLVLKAAESVLRASKAALARDTVFAVVMIVCNGIVGICLLSGGVRHYEQGFQVQGGSAALAVLAALTTLTLVVPNTTGTAGPFFSTPQLIFAGAVSLVLYGSFVFVQTVRHRDYFLPVLTEEEDVSAPQPSGRTAIVSVGLLLAALVAVVGLAKALTPAVEIIVGRVGAPKPVVGIIIATLVLLPEGLTALKAAGANRLQTSLNLSASLFQQSQPYPSYWVNLSCLDSMGRSKFSWQLHCWSG